MTSSEQSDAPLDDSRAADLPQLADFQEAARIAAKGRASVDFEALNQKLKASGDVPPPDLDGSTNAETAPSPMPQDGGLEERLEELADDQLELLRQVQELKAANAVLTQRIVELSQIVSQSYVSLNQNVGQLRGELVSQRRGMAVKSVFDNLIGPYERLRIMAEALAAQTVSPGGESANPPEARLDQNAVRNQIQSVVMILGRAIRELGFEEYQPQAGQPFDPERMACVGYAPGDPGIVLKLVKPGFRAGDLVTVPAEVLIADPTSSNESPASGDDE